VSVSPRNAAEQAGLRTSIRQRRKAGAVSWSLQGRFAAHVSAPVAIGSVSLHRRERTGKNVNFSLKTGGSDA
jgi:hypothetical protein